ncbi:MAG: dienelactone hydrolase family protein [Calothrix sp. MO_167.B12]|nr:dienelactone hydrolase family protein [Calothrix sp. MO_167.B12]
MKTKSLLEIKESTITIEVGRLQLIAELFIPDNVQSIIVFVDRSGCSREHICNYHLAQVLGKKGLATILIDLLTPEEEAIDLRSKHCSANIRHLAERLIAVTDWLTQNPITHNLQIGYLGDGTGGGAALVAATERPLTVKAVVVRSGLIDLVSEVLDDVQAPTLLIVGGYDLPAIAMNEDTLTQISTQHKRLKIVPQASHHFAQPDAWQKAAQLTSQWFQHYLPIGIRFDS